jgi:phage gp37-like protein
MSSFSWTTVEDAVVTALKTQLGPEVRTVMSYQGDWRTDLQQEAWRLPATLVMLKSSRADQIGVSSYDLILDLEVLVLVRQLRGEAAGRREAGGAYDLLAKVREALWHQDLGLDVTPFALIQEEPLLNDEEFTVYTAQYRTATVQDR